MVRQNVGEDQAGQCTWSFEGRAKRCSCKFSVCVIDIDLPSNDSQAKYPDLISSVKQTLTTLRKNGAQITVVTARGILLVTVMSSAPEILDVKFTDGSTFRASESFIRKWLHDALGWSRRKETQAAQKVPEDADDQCERLFLRKAYVMKKEDLLAVLFVNSDQTQTVFAPGDKMTWTEAEEKQVVIHGGDEKRAFTLMVSVGSDGTVLPMQAIYAGKTSRSCPSPNSPHYQDLINAGFLLEESGTATYWSNHKTMHSFVDKILAPYFNRRKDELGLHPSHKALWNIDVWLVHQSAEFKDWMHDAHPSIMLNYVPSGCTGKFQPCDVGVQRPLKLSLKRSYHKDVVAELLGQMKANTPVVHLDTRIGTLRDRSTRWIWNAFNAINNETLVKKVCFIKLQ